MRGLRGLRRRGAEEVEGASALILEEARGLRGQEGAD